MNSEDLQDDVSELEDTVCKLQKENEQLKQENKALREAYRAKPVGVRKAVKVVLEQAFEHLEEIRNLNFTKNTKEEVIELIADDSNWWDDLDNCLDNYLDSVGENYGIE